jgi:hypothetical protein
LAGLGVDLTDVVGVLASQAVQKFEESWNDLPDTVRRAPDSAGSTP